MRIASLLLTAIALATCAAAGDREYIEVSMYPYYHSPSKAWQVVIQSDGEVTYRESSYPVEVSSLPITVEPEWVDVSGRVTRVSEKQWKRLVELMQAASLESLKSHYSAGYSVPSEDPDEFFARVVTHGDNYRIRLDIGDLKVDSAVYAPLSALSQQDPSHPQREEIRKIVEAWYHLLRVVGPVDGYRAKEYRRWVR